MKIGLVGAGRIGILHVSTLAELERVSSLYIADSDASRAQHLAQAFGGTAVSTETLLSRVDAVVVAASTSAHAEIVLAGLDRNLPIFCEKPLALDMPSTLAVLRHLREHSGRLQIGFQRRFDPGYQAARDAVFSGRMGKILSVRTTGHDAEPPPEDYIPHSGGIFKDLCIHDFDAVRYVTGEEVRDVYAVGSIRGSDIYSMHDDTETVTAVLTLDSGVPVALSASRHQPFGYDIRMEVVGEHDAVAVGLNARSPIRLLDSPVDQSEVVPYPDFQTRFSEAYRREISTFLDFASGQGASPCSAWDAAKALQIADACHLSRVEGRPITVPLDLPQP